MSALDYEVQYGLESSLACKVEGKRLFCRKVRYLGFVRAKVVPD